MFKYSNFPEDNQNQSRLGGVYNPNHNPPGPAPIGVPYSLLENIILVLFTPMHPTDHLSKIGEFLLNYADNRRQKREDKKQKEYAKTFNQ